MLKLKRHRLTCQSQTAQWKRSSVKLGGLTTGLMLGATMLSRLPLIAEKEGSFKRITDSSYLAPDNDALNLETS